MPEVESSPGLPPPRRPHMLDGLCRDELEPIFGKPGSEWTPDERRQVIVALNSRPVLRVLLVYCYSQLGDFAQFADAEDAYSSFAIPSVLTGRSPLGAVIDAYDPGHSPEKPGCIQFANLLLKALKRFCRRIGMQIEKRRRRFEDPVPAGLGEDAVEVEIPAPSGSNPERDVIQTEDEAEAARVEAARRVALTGCLNELRPPDRYIIVEHDIKGRPLKQIAAELGIAEVAARVRHHRALRRLRECLDEGGYLSGVLR